MATDSTGTARSAPRGGGNRGQPERVRDHSREWIGEKIKERMDRGRGEAEDYYLGNIAASSIASRDDKITHRASCS